MKVIKRDIVLVGGGHASIPLLKRAHEWSRQGLSVTLITASQHLYYSGMVPEYLGGVYEKEDIRVDLQALCLASDIEFRKARVTALEPDQKEVRTSNGKTYRCGIAVFDIGSHNPRIPREENVTPTKPLHRIEKIADFTESLVFEPDLEDRKNLVIVGGGAAGVEIALNISARLRGQHRHTHLAITLIEEQERILGRFPHSLSRHVGNLLQKRGVDVRIMRKSTEVTRNTIILDGDHEVNFDFILWATGPVGQPLFNKADLECDQRNFLWIDHTLQHQEHPWLFGAGDCIRVRQHPHLMKLGIHAVKQGKILEKNVNKAIEALQDNYPLDQLDLSTFRPYAITPVVISTGGPEAIWTTERFWVSNRFMLYLKHWIDNNWIEKYQYPFNRKYPIAKKFHGRHALNL